MSRTRHHRHKHRKKWNMKFNDCKPGMERKKLAARERRIKGKNLVKFEIEQNNL